MGIRHQYGYSAEVEAFFVAAGARYRVAKTNGAAFSLAESCELPPRTEGDLLVIIDGSASSRRIVLPDGVEQEQTTVKYTVATPF